MNTSTILRGFDASSVQGKLPFSLAAAAGLSFAIFKCWEGNSGGDPDFAVNVQGAKAAGIEPLPYCFAYPLQSDGVHLGRSPLEQAKFFVDHAWKVLPGCRIFLDLEWPAPQEWAKWGLDAAKISAWCRECCEEVTRLCNGLKPVIYTYPDWWAHVSAADVSWAAEYPLWLAAYVHAWPQPGDSPKIPKPFTDWLFWQWDGNGGQKLPNGVDADFCVFKGSIEDLKACVYESASSPSENPDFDIVHPDVEASDSDPTPNS